ncbi:hypothetical protein F4820DRAFT_322995 [Hypoxylon rubiginosum]|uniref:Uncharacterized protein n=1 Tax=Hypoxylon rubiginosum TaxID=110542 RepID=A0ACB9YZG2_9PEZI|nr:hypothetical protein F4820DRAFT_322995 [Hypoxylon rubiginosum]
MDLQDNLDQLVKKRLEVTTPEPVDAKMMTQLQQNPQPRESPRNTRAKRPKDANSISDRKSRSRNLTRDEKLRIRIAKEYFPTLSYVQLAQATGSTYSQVQNALHGPLTPKKRRVFRKVRHDTQPNTSLQP